MANRKNGGPTLYATNFHYGTIDVFDSSFHMVTTFVDPNLFPVPASAPSSPGWALFFLDDRLYFTAGIADEAHGLFGFIQPAD